MELTPSDDPVPILSDMLGSYAHELCPWLDWRVEVMLAEDGTACTIRVTHPFEGGRLGLYVEVPAAEWPTYMDPNACAATASRFIVRLAQNTARLN